MQKISKNLIHKGLECGWSVCETKRHDQKFVMAVMSAKGCLLNIPCPLESDGNPTSNPTSKRLERHEAHPTTHQLQELETYQPLFLGLEPYNPHKNANYCLFFNK